MAVMVEASSQYYRTTDNGDYMKRVLNILIGFTALTPTLAAAEEAGHGSYRGIGFIYFTIMGAILIYGVYDAFGKKAMLMAAPIIVIGLYLMLPPGP